MMALKRKITLITLLAACFALQAAAMTRTDAFPDLVILLVVFSGIFLGGAEAVLFGLLAGLLRGAFSVGTIGIDLVLFPVVGGISSMMGGMFYRQNPAAQVLTVTVALLIVVSAHTVLLNLYGGNDIGLIHVLTGSWKAIFLTLLVAPLFFFLSKRLLEL